MAYGLAVGEITSTGDQTARNARYWLINNAWRRMQRRTLGPPVAWNGVSRYKGMSNLQQE